MCRQTLSNLEAAAANAEGAADAAAANAAAPDTAAAATAAAAARAAAPANASVAAAHTAAHAAQETAAKWQSPPPSIHRDSQVCKEPNRRNAPPGLIHPKIGRWATVARAVKEACDSCKAAGLDAARSTRSKKVPGHAQQ